MEAAEAARLILMYAVFPLWVAGGLADWACHRRTRIERTSGLPENIFHWGLFGQMGLAALAVGLLEVNAAILLLVFAAFLAHELTTYLELRYTVPRREVGPFEQMVHSFMELLPLVALALLATMAWDQALALFGIGEPDFSLREKEQPWPRGYLLAALGAGVLFNALPMAEETVRCLRHSREGGNPGS
ncbi:MAG: diguanylate cyclase [Ramlibacter sp.]